MSSIKKRVDNIWLCRGEGMNALEYMEQIAFLLFLKMWQMSQEEELKIHSTTYHVPEDISWKILANSTEENICATYSRILHRLGTLDGPIGSIFCQATNKFQEPAKLLRLVVDYIDKESWPPLGSGARSEVFEALLLRSTFDKKCWDGQHLTPHALTQGIVEVVRPTLNDEIVDPACGAGEFLLAAYNYAKTNFPTTMLTDAESPAFPFAYGAAYSKNVALLAKMITLLFGTEVAFKKIEFEEKNLLLEEVHRQWPVVLTNPPFGRSISVNTNNSTNEIVRGKSVPYRLDFVIKTSDKALNFLQLAMSILADEGRAAVIVPESTLFAAAGAPVRRRLLSEFDFHTILRLPKNVFPSGHVEANVLFFDRLSRSQADISQDATLWVYDLRGRWHRESKRAPMHRPYLDDFVARYLPNRPRQDRQESEDFKAYSRTKLIAQNGVDLSADGLSEDIFSGMLSPESIAQTINDDFEVILTYLDSTANSLKKELVSNDTCGDSLSDALDKTEKVSKILRNLRKWDLGP